jgi:23S rRNA pseudouridine2604 synthase
VFEGQAMPPARVSWQSEKRLRFAAKGIAPEWVPWMCEQVGLTLTALKRIRIGRIPWPACRRASGATCRRASAF